jgi:hypothetical protein
LYLFTTLRDPEQYPLAELMALYARRWEVEMDYRHLKTSLELAEFTAKSPALFRKELAAGLLTYNLICALMTQAALQADLAPTQLSFRRCYRRIRAWLIVGLPAWVDSPAAVTEYLLARLARGTLPRNPTRSNMNPAACAAAPPYFRPSRAVGTPPGSRCYANSPEKAILSSIRLKPVGTYRLQPVFFRGCTNRGAD